VVESTEPVGHLHIHARMIAARISSDWQYRTSFFTFAAAQALIAALELLAIVLLFQLVPDIGGWTGGEVAFLYVLAALPFALADLTVSAVERVSVYIQSGDFDRVLLRPIPALLQLSSTRSICCITCTRPMQPDIARTWGTSSTGWSSGRS
jgi:ABC-type uncharacterized transport system permease subunit